MTDKQIIIDGVDVSGCKHYKNRNCIADYCLTDMSFSEAKCGLNPNCYYKQLKRKEQECERLIFPMPDTNYAILTKEEFERLDQLKAENEKLKAEKVKYYQQTLDDEIQINELLQTLTEIKEIAEPFCDACQEFEPQKSKNCINCTYCNYNEILQKISEGLKDG